MNDRVEIKAAEGQPDRSDEFDGLFPSGVVEVFLDTSEYEGNQYDFENDRLGRLRAHAEAGRAQIHSVTVIQQEIKRHLKARFERATKLFSDPALKALPKGKRPAVAFSEGDFLDTFESWSARVKVHGIEQVDLTELMERYDKAAPPFGLKDKKNEFPDAIAAAALEVWAMRHELSILVVSRDTDWQSIAQASKNLVSANLNEVLDYLGRLHSRERQREQAFENAKARINEKSILDAIDVQVAERAGEYEHWLDLDGDLELVEDLEFSTNSIEIYLGDVEADLGVAEISGVIRGDLYGVANNPDDTFGIYDSAARPFHRKLRVRREVEVEFNGRVVLNPPGQSDPILEQIDFGWSDIEFGVEDILPRSRRDDE